MRDSIAAFLTERNITGTVYCAVSGGADSMALLHCLWMLREQHHLTLCAVHFHHHLRGEAADRDAQFVAAFCDAYGIPPVSYTHLDVYKRQSQSSCKS